MDTSVISTLSTCFWVCLSFTVLFFVISVILFFLFDIKTIFNIKTGRAQAKTVKEMKAANEKTGRLRVDGKTQTSKLSEEEKNVARAPAVSAPPKTQEQNQPYNTGSEDTEVLPQNGFQTNQNRTSDFAETTVLSENMTGDLGRNDIIQTTDNINFKVVKKIISICTDEVI